MNPLQQLSPVGWKKKKRETLWSLTWRGETYDVSILEKGDGDFEVISNWGDSHLGGDIFDKVFVDHMAETFQKVENIDLRTDTQALQRHTEAFEKTQIELSSTTQSEINRPFITATTDEPKHLTLRVKRENMRS